MESPKLEAINPTGNRMYPLKPISHLYKRIILILSISEVVLGLTNIGIGASFSFQSTYLTAFWVIGGIWISITGFIGTFSGTRFSNACLINTHMSFCITSALGGAGLSFIGFYQSSPFHLELFPVSPLLLPGDPRLLALGVLDCFVVLFCVMSASFCCAVNSALGYSGACGGCVCVQMEKQPRTETDQPAAENLPPTRPYNNTHLIPRVTQVKYTANQA